MPDKYAILHKNNLDVLIDDLPSYGKYNHGTNHYNYLSLSHDLKIFSFFWYYQYENAPCLDYEDVTNQYYLLAWVDVNTLRKESSLIYSDSKVLKYISHYRQNGMLHIQCLEKGGNEVEVKVKSKQGYDFDYIWRVIR